jgi:TRAP-type mannitol/chloroaromatic compound transport system substrate-binding protein
LSSSVGNRKKFIATASATAAAAGALALPATVKAQTTSLRFQSTWPAKDIFPGMTLWLPEFLYGK